MPKPAFEAKRQISSEARNAELSRKESHTYSINAGLAGVARPEAQAKFLQAYSTRRRCGEEAGHSYTVAWRPPVVHSASMWQKFGAGVAAASGSRLRWGAMCQWHMFGTPANAGRPRRGMRPGPRRGRPHPGVAARNGVLAKALI